MHEAYKSIYILRNSFLKNIKIMTEHIVSFDSKFTILVKLPTCNINKTNNKTLKNYFKNYQIKKN